MTITFLKILEPSVFIPAVAQGAIAVETRSEDKKVNALLSAIDDKTTKDAVTAERSFMRHLQGGCQVPVGAYSMVNKDNITLKGFCFLRLMERSTLQKTLTGKVSRCKKI